MGHYIAVFEQTCLIPEQVLFCQDLCLLSKCFIDDKSLSYDVSYFKFYVMYHVSTSIDLDEDNKSQKEILDLLQRDETTSFDIIGYFSKDKKPEKNYNLSCFMILPHFRGLGLGRFLISLSYELARREKKIGGPEDPLSRIATKAYQSFWKYTLIRYLVEHYCISTKLTTISEDTGIETHTILETLKAEGILSHTENDVMKIMLSDSHVDWLTDEHEKVKETLCRKKSLLL